MGLRHSLPDSLPFFRRTIPDSWGGYSIDLSSLATGTHTLVVMDKIGGNATTNSCSVMTTGARITQLNVTAASSTVQLGDVNLDGVVNLLDVSPFVDLISMGLYQAGADINQDGFVNLRDVSPFIGILAP